MHASCVQRWRGNSCPNGCKNSEFDRARALQDLGFDCSSVRPPPQPSRSEQLASVGRQYMTEDDFKPYPVSDTNLPIGLTTVGNCTVPSCGWGLALRTHWAVGEEHDIICSPEKTMCKCGAQLKLTQLLFRNCSFRVELCEAFQGGRKRRAGARLDSHGKVMAFDLPGHYTVFRVSTKHCPVDEQMKMTTKTTQEQTRVLYQQTSLEFGGQTGVQYEQMPLELCGQHRTLDQQQTRIMYEQMLGSGDQQTVVPEPHLEQCVPGCGGVEQL